MATVRLRAGNVQPVWAGHPWVFAQAIADVDGAPADGSIVTVVDARGQFLGRGFYSSKSAIPVRILTRSDHDTLDARWLGDRIEHAARWRKDLLGLPNEATTGYRLVHAEGDGLAGLVVDVFGDVAVVQLLTLGMKLREDAVFAEVERVTGAKTIIEQPSDRMQRLEGFEVKTHVVRGPDVSLLRFRERGLAYEVAVEEGQKTGFYFDQRENRAIAERFAKGKRVLDAFCYVGGFALAAARGGATEVIAIDSSAAALVSAGTNAHHNGLDGRIAFQRGDVKRSLVDLAEDGKRFDVVVIDPPKLVPTAKHLEQGRTAYRRLNAAALRLVERGGLLVSCSCSAAMRAADFLRTIGLAARDARRDVALLELTGQAADHPVPPAFPEGQYLKCAVLRVD